jgi:hypothetical protein
VGVGVGWSETATGVAVPVADGLGVGESVDVGNGVNVDVGPVVGVGEIVGLGLDVGVGVGKLISAPVLAPDRKPWLFVDVKYKVLLTLALIVNGPISAVALSVEPSALFVTDKTAPGANE